MAGVSFNGMEMKTNEKKIKMDFTFDAVKRNTTCHSIIEVFFIVAIRCVCSGVMMEF
jgi:hypothetical protein